MGEDHVADTLKCDAAGDRHLKLRHELAAFDAQDGGAEDLACAPIHDCFDEVAGFVELNGTGDTAHPHREDADVPIPLSRLGFRLFYSEGPANTRLRVTNPGVPRLYLPRDIRGGNFSPVKSGGAAVNRKGLVAAVVLMILAFGVASLVQTRIVGGAEAAQAVRL